MNLPDKEDPKRYALNWQNAEKVLVNEAILLKTHARGWLFGTSRERGSASVWEN